MTEAKAMGKLWRYMWRKVGVSLLLSFTLAATTTVTSALTLSVVLLASQVGWAATATVTVKGTVIAKPKCEINGGQDIFVSFNELITTKIDGDKYGKRPIPYEVSCSGNMSGNAGLLKVSLRGLSPDFGDGLLRTNNNDLAIKLLQENGQQLKLNAWINFTYPFTPALSAVPVKRSGATLKGGDFSSSATLLVEVQ
ncbi:fimbrial protein [Serratia marcescens]|uniref:fimbrial protein n=1 Tax=Serratia marcescens TaxID=615 RepID=UPI002DBE8BA0|nr:fimbrial protein [Serratia marcescens]MEB6083372.1 fimbrial protein [Serratia marcescens]